MTRKASPRPTDAELAILRVLWVRGPSTVAQVQESLVGERPAGYTTVLKFLQIMHEKNLVERDESNRTHVYRTRESQEHTQRHLLSDLVTRAFGGSSAQLVVQALSSKKSSPQELARIRALLDELEGEKK